MPARPAPTLVTEEEFLDLPETMERVELLDGEVIVSPSPSDEHQRLLGELFFHLRGWVADHPPGAVRLAPLDVRFAPGRILQPDLAVWLGGLPPAVAMPIATIPDLVVEVMSQRRSYDRITKRAVYGEAGVREYWVVDPALRAVEVFRADGSATSATEVLRSDLLPGFSLELPGLFEG